jgi:hypothetical protein
MIHILYRHTSHTSGMGKNRPHWFSYEKSLNNLLSTIEGLDFVKFHLIYDGECNITDPRIHHIENIKAGSDCNSYFYSWHYAKSLNIGDKDLIYIAENDYAYVHGWIHKIKELFDAYEDLDYVTLYDHNDKYNPIMYPNLATYLFITKSHHWRITPSTTGSVIFGKRILDEDFDIHSVNCSDFGRYEFLRTNRNRNVLSPIPSLATHCEVEWLAPVIDWEKTHK